MTNSIHSSLGDLKLSFAISQKSLFQHWDMLQFQSNSSILPISTTTQVSSEKAILSWSFFHFRVGLSLRGLPFSSWLSPMRTCDCPVCASSWPSGLLFPVPPAGTSHVRLSAFLFLSPHIQAMPHSRYVRLLPLEPKERGLEEVLIHVMFLQQPVTSSVAQRHLGRISAISTFGAHCNLLPHFEPAFLLLHLDSCFLLQMTSHVFHVPKFPRSFITTKGNLIFSVLLLIHKHNYIIDTGGKGNILDMYLYLYNCIF